MMRDRESPSIDPELWGKLSPELVERILGKLPFESLVNFRGVCKPWESILIPSIVASGIRPSGTSVLLYFDLESGWLELSNSKKWSGTTPSEEYRPRSFPPPKLGDAARLVSSEGGLLLFTVMSNEKGNRKWEFLEFLVRNPLLGQSKILSLPSHLVPQGALFIYNTMLLGVIVNEQTGKYKIVVAGVVDVDPRMTLMYDSHTDAWKKTAPVPQDQEDGEWRCQNRSICSNGNVYWYVSHTGMYGHSLSKSLLKFDLQNEIWSKVRERGGSECPLPSPFSHSQISLHKGEPSFMHVHAIHKFGNALGRRLVPDFLCQVSQSRTAYHQLGSEMKILSRELITKVEEFLEEDLDFRGQLYDDYFCLGRKHLFYHLKYLRRNQFVNTSTGLMKVSGLLRIIVHNTDDNTYTHLPALQDDTRLPQGACLVPSNIWEFSPSLHAVG